MPPELLQIAVLGLLSLLSVAAAIIGFFAARTLSKIDANQTILFEKYSELERRFCEFLGEARARWKAEEP